MKTNWYDALGETVPYTRRARAAEVAEEMGLSLEGKEELEYINPICEAIEQDNPEKAIAKAREKLDLTGSFRLIGYLCVPGENNES